jgi:hypothetical protein
MRTGIRRTLGLALTVAALPACHLPPMISDTGCRGTWTRRNAYNQTIVAITEVEGRWYFRWDKRMFDGSQTVRCDWDGHCDERLNDMPAATYTITTSYDAASGTLTAATVEERVHPTKRTLRYTELMQVADAGRTLFSYTTERDGEAFVGGGRPQRSFTKVADSVADPPRRAHP